MKIVTIVGARPQFVKAAVVSRNISMIEGISEVLVHTGQHYNANMSDVFFEELDIRKPDHHLGIGGGTHGQNTGRMLEAIELVLLQEKPDWVLVYGDTDSTLAGALAAGKLHIPIAHVEAGLRSYNRCMPEEINRVLTDHASSLLFAPTITAMNNLEVEGIWGDKVYLSGDVMYDAMLYYQPKYRKPVTLSHLLPGFTLCTIHRAENTDDPSRLAAIIRILNSISETRPVIIPLHPRTANAIKKLSEIKLSDSVYIIDPVGYLEMNWLLANCSVVITDSGGLQKEAFFHMKPCMTLRDETEWVELVIAGYNMLVSPFEKEINSRFNEATQIKISAGDAIYGKGDSGRIIVDQLIKKMA
jgi:UDP-GlcNAc3NAcA epimerase